MADINIDKFRTTVVRDGSRPSSSGFVESEGQDPVNPPGTNNFVPYSGATDNVDLGEFGVEAGFVTLDTTPTNTPTDQGTIYWDDSRSTAALIMNGTLQHIGQDTFYYVKNSTGSSIPKGTAVGFAGTDGASGHLLITPFLANGSVPSTYFMGVTAEEIANGAFGQVMHFGELQGINTSAYTAGALLYASSTVAGAFQTTAPVAPNNIILVAAAVNSKNNGAIVVRPQIGSNINTDEGVRITSPTTGDLLQLQVGGLWENKTVAQVIGSAYVPSSRTITINGTAFDLSANRSWTVGDVRTDGSYSNPSWITALAWSKITGTPTTLSGYGITDAVQTSRTITINGVTQDLSANRTFNVGTVTSVTATSPLFSSGGATPNITIQQASGSQSGFLSSTDWTTFNNKQNALTNPVTGTGTTNYLPKFTGSTTIGNSIVQDNGVGYAVGIGVTTSSWFLGGLNAIQIQNGGIYGYSTSEVGITANAFYNASLGGWRYISNGVSTFYQQTGGSHSWHNAPSGTAGNAISFTQAMTLFSTGNLLVGSPSPISDNGARLQVSGRVNATGGGSNGVLVSSNSGSVTIPTTGLSLNTGFNVGYLQNFNGGNYVDLYYGASKHIFDGGNVGIGVNPSSWDTGNTVRAVEISQGAFWGYGSTNVYLASNYYWSGSNRIYLKTAAAAEYSITNGAHEWYSASSGTAGTAVTLNPRMVITSGGNVGIGTPSPNQRLEVNGRIRVSSNGSNGGDMAVDDGGIAFSTQGSTPIAFWRDNYTNQSMRIFAGGNVFIGPSPSDNGARLQVSGTATFSSSVTAKNYGISEASAFRGGVYTFNQVAGTGTDYSVGIFSESEIYLASGGSATKKVVLTSGGNVGIGTNSPAAAISGTERVLQIANSNVASVYLNCTSANNYALFSSASGNFTIYNTTAGASRLSITSGGNVLIGTTTSTGAKLEVNGDIRTGALDGGYVSGFWKLGRALIGSQPSETHQIIVEINGALFTIGAAAL